MSAHKNKRRGSGARGSQKLKKVNRNGWLSHDQQKHRKLSLPAPKAVKPLADSRTTVTQRRW